MIIEQRSPMSKGLGHIGTDSSSPFVTAPKKQYLEHQMFSGMPEIALAKMDKESNLPAPLDEDQIRQMKRDQSYVHTVFANAEYS